jgi:hypothetical protein
MAKIKRKTQHSSPPSSPPARSLAITAQSAADERKAARVLLFCELESIRLRSCSSESAEFPNKLTGPYTLKFRDPVGRAIGINGPHIVTEATVDLESLDSSENKKVVFRCSGTFQLEYHMEEGFDPTEDEIKAFAETYAVFNSWPYIRETLQTITQRMGFNPPPLPLLRLVPPDVKAAKGGRAVRPSAELLEG